MDNDNIAKFSASLPMIRDMFGHILKIFAGMVKLIAITAPIAMIMILLTGYFLGELNIKNLIEMSVGVFVVICFSYICVLILFFLILPLVLYFNEKTCSLQCDRVEVDIEKKKFHLYSNAGEISFNSEDIAMWGIDERTNKVLGIRLQNSVKNYTKDVIAGRKRNKYFIPLWFFDSRLCDYLRQNRQSLLLPDADVIKGNYGYYSFFYDAMKMTLSEYYT